MLSYIVCSITCKVHLNKAEIELNLYLERKEQSVSVHFCENRVMV